MANTYSDLTATTVASNYKRISASTQFGTRVLRFIKVTISGGSPPDLTSGYDDSIANSTGNSYYAKAVNALQGYAEVYAVFAPSSTAFIAIVSDDTAQDSDTNTNVNGGWGDAEANILAALGSWGSGAVAITTGAISGGTLSFS
jgi:hypothetical protein